jgi:hypothetical protein
MQNELHRKLGYIVGILRVPAALAFSANPQGASINSIRLKNIEDYCFMRIKLLPFINPNIISILIKITNIPINHFIESTLMNS